MAFAQQQSQFGNAEQANAALNPIELISPPPTLGD
jgi:hypothetical protein